jgi:hypothetical protein
MTGQPLDSSRVARRRARHFVRRWPREKKWLFGALLALDIGLLLIALAFANVTDRGPAERALGRSVAILTEVDTLLDEHYASLHNEAQQTNETTITLPDFPLPITFTPQEIASTDREQFRALLLQRSAVFLHENGAAAFREGRASEIDSLSPQGAVRIGLDLLRPTPHRVFAGLTIAFASIATVLAITLALSTQGWGRLTALGVSLFVAAVPFLIFAVALRFALRLAADGTDDYVAREFLQLGQELTWAPIRDGVVFAGGAVLLLVIGAQLTRWSDTQGTS